MKTIKKTDRMNISANFWNQSTLFSDCTILKRHFLFHTTITSSTIHQNITYSILFFSVLLKKVHCTWLIKKKMKNEIIKSNELNQNMKKI